NDRQSLDLTPLPRPAVGGPAEWRISQAPVRYPDAVAAMEARVAEIATHQARELVWLLEHPPLYTSGTSGKAQDLLDPRFPMSAIRREWRSSMLRSGGRSRMYSVRSKNGCQQRLSEALKKARGELHAVCPGSLCLGVFFSRCGVIFAGSGAPGTPRGPNCSR